MCEGSWSLPDTSGKLFPEELTRARAYPPPPPHLGPTLQVQDGRSTSYPSLLSHLTSMYLNTPVLALPVAKRQLPGPSLRSFHPLASSLPCDFHLLNLRTLQAEVSVPPHSAPQGQAPAFPHPDSSRAQYCLLGSRALPPGSPECPGPPTAPCVSVTQDDALPSAETALILHRKGFDCGLEAKNLGFNCTTSQGKVSAAQVWAGKREGCREGGSEGGTGGGGPSRAFWREREKLLTGEKQARPGGGTFWGRASSRRRGLREQRPLSDEVGNPRKKTPKATTLLFGKLYSWLKPVLIGTSACHGPCGHQRVQRGPRRGPQGPTCREAPCRLREALQEVTGRIEEERPAQPRTVFLSTGGPGEPLPRPGRGFPAADLPDVTVPSGLTLQQH